MSVDREITFELDDRLRDRIYSVSSDADAVALLHRLGVRDRRITGHPGWDFRFIANRIRSSEQQYGSAPFDFSDDPLMGLGRFIVPEGRLWCRPDYDRPLVGIRIMLDESSSTSTGVRVVPLRAEPTEVVIPEGITTMDAFSFMGCPHIRKVAIPSSMREIPAGAFWGCSGLTGIVVPDGVTSIGPAAFACCDNLRRVVLPASLEHIGCGAFRGCGSLEEVVASTGLTVPDAAHVFDDCKLPAYGYCRQSDQPVDKERAWEDLDELLYAFTSMRLDGLNSVYSFMIDTVDAPDPRDTNELAGDAADQIHRMLEMAVDSFGSISRDDYVKTTEEDLLILSRLIVDALESISEGGAAPKAYECTPDLWDECKKQCFAITGAIMIRAGSDWYLLFADWSD